MTQKEKIANLESRLAAAEAAAEAEEAERIDPAIMQAASKNAGYALKDIELAFKLLKQDLTDEQVETIRAGVLQSKLDYLMQTTSTGNSLTASY